jgi:uncharacterized protein CbrC (UPF0167 family)
LKDNQLSINEKVIDYLLSRLDKYSKKTWHLGRERDLLDVLLETEDRKFRYVADEAIPDIFYRTRKTCSICSEEKELTILHARYPESLVICADCIANGAAWDRYNIRFHPEKSFVWNTTVPFYQVWLLTSRTPPINTFNKDLHDEYRWARHCGDFALYLGDVHPEKIKRSLLDKLASEQGVDADYVIDGYDSLYGNTYIHKFECLFCKKILHILD